MKFLPRQHVWLVVEPEARGIVTGVVLDASDTYLYRVSWACLQDTEHYDFELSATKPGTDFDHDSDASTAPTGP